MRALRRYSPGPYRRAEAEELYKTGAQGGGGQQEVRQRVQQQDGAEEEQREEKEEGEGGRRKDAEALVDNKNPILRIWGIKKIKKKSIKPNRKNQKIYKTEPPEPEPDRTGTEPNRTEPGIPCKRRNPTGLDQTCHCGLVDRSTAWSTSQPGSGIVRVDHGLRVDKGLDQLAL